MEYTIIQREPGVFQQSVPLHQMQAMCERAFGPRPPITSIREQGGGQFNNTYLVHMADHDPIILRVAPPPERCQFWHEKFLMRRELSIQPFLAPIAPLLPRVIMADFTHQLIDRDYMFETCMPGEPWLSISKDLAPGERDELWRQFGRLVKTISSVQGEAFGLIDYGPQFFTWSLTIIDWLDRTIADAQSYNLDTMLLQTLLSIVYNNRALLDEITRPRLLHGDLWSFNLLVEQREKRPQIVAVLDADRGSWGDPMADWTFFLLSHRASAREQALFWQEYGIAEQGTGAQFRAQVYEGLHQGKILSVARRAGQARVVARAYDALGKAVMNLQRFLNADTLPSTWDYLARTG
jgi:aminoglycoside phosphotransferase (APT) family kinase protein